MITDLVKIGTSPAVTCPRAAPINQAARLMNERNVGCVIVVDDDQALVGVVTDRDLAVRAVGRGLDPDTPVHEVMTHEVASILEHASLLDAVRQMSVRGCRRLPVVDDHGHVRAVVSLDDIYRVAGEVLGQIDAIVSTGHAARLHRVKV